MPHILIVEDEPTTSWALSEGLSDDGFTIDAFRSAEEAWGWLRNGGHSDLVISDLEAPRDERARPRAQATAVVATPSRW